MTFGWALGLLIAFIVLIMSSGIAQSWIVSLMTEQINRKKTSGPTVVWPPDISWSSFKNGLTFWSVWKHYRVLCPDGKLSRLLIVWVCLMFLSLLGVLYLLFAILPEWALPSR